MELSNLAIILLFLFPVIILLSKNSIKGICLSVLYLVCLPPSLDIKTLGSFPNFTIHRLIVILLFLLLILKGKQYRRKIDIPFKRLLVLFLSTNFISLLISVDFILSLKQYLSYIIEVVLYYFIMLKIIRTKKDALEVYEFIFWGLSVVSILAIIEKYTMFNPVNEFVYGVIRLENSGNVISTYPHRILLGVGMAMAFPIGISLIRERNINTIRYYLFWSMLILCLIGCYFSMSRGPWLAVGLAGISIFFLCSDVLKKKILLILLIIPVILFTKPGIYSTLDSLFEATFDTNSIRGANYQYRWELWEIAFDEILKSPERTIWGYGQGSIDKLKIQADVSIYGRKKAYIISWDNHYAWYLVSTGIFGLLSVLLLFATIGKRIYLMRINLNACDKDILSCIFSSVFALISN
jgi:hypothetical protein